MRRAREARLRRRRPGRDRAPGGPDRRPRRETRHGRGRRGRLAGGIAHPRESRVPQEPLQPPDGREPRGGLAVPAVRPPGSTRGAWLARQESPRERRGGGDRRDPARGGRPPAVRVRGRPDERSPERDRRGDPRDPSREDERPRTGDRRLGVRGALVVLDRYRKAADWFLVPVASRMLRVNPNAVSWIAFLAAVGAGVSFFIGGRGFLSLALVLILVNSYLDALDGKIAKMAGKSSARGDFLDHVLDRYADVFMLGGVAFNAMYCHLEVGTLALLGVLLTSYMGTQAQAVGQGRAYGGILGRADRLVLLFLGGLISLLNSPSGGMTWGVGVLTFGPGGGVMVLLAVLSNAAAGPRGVEK